MSTRKVTSSSGRTREQFDAYGHNIPEPYDGQVSPMFYEDHRVPHEDVDNDDLRKEQNRYRHSSYRK